MAVMTGNGTIVGVVIGDVVNVGWPYGRRSFLAAACVSWFEPKKSPVVTRPCDMHDVRCPEGPGSGVGESVSCSMKLDLLGCGRSAGAIACYVATIWESRW